MLNKYYKFIPTILASFILVAFFVFQYDLNPWDGQTFLAHDKTQATRVSEFTLNLTHGQIPPRIAPNMSFGLGYPIFNYYAPFAYWVTSAINLTGIPIIAALELSYILALIVAYIGMNYFLKQYISDESSVVGALLYVMSPFIAVDIFVRGNLAEVWFLALLPLTLYMLSQVNKRRLFITALVVSFLFSVHNIFSLLAVGILIAFALIIRNRFALLSILGGFLLSAYFLIPALVELPFVHAENVATITNYSDHFVCPSQLWQSPWGYGGSIPGCEWDGMSFMLGKLQLIMGISGIGFLLFNLVRRTKMKHKKIMIAMAFFLAGSVFMSTKYSEIIWLVFEKGIALFQFPWRFLLLVVFGLSFFGTYALSESFKIIPLKAKSILAVLIGLGIINFNINYFQGNKISNTQYQNQFVSAEYVANIAAYNVAEYLPITADYEIWRLLENIDFRKQSDVPKMNEGLFERTIFQKAGQDVIINIHNADYWIIQSKDEIVVPESLDTIGRPIIAKTDYDREINITYQQTLVEQIANSISLLSGILLVTYSYLWNKKNNKI
ncbi:MAG: 6-pyruvoyl-tetrahydropterin synthase-related protein [bacterium]|nr:6-pyruvoyl-tetrahydropterin synthase-related protein [bacterium]